MGERLSCYLLSLILLIGWSSQVQNVLELPNTIFPASPAPSAPNQQQENPDLYFDTIIGLTATEIANLNGTDVSAWEHTTNMFGFDYFFDAKNNMTYLFCNNGEPLNGAEVCTGVLFPIGKLFLDGSPSSEDVLLELSCLLDTNFTWFADENENLYSYLADLMYADAEYQVCIFTDQNQMFDLTYAIQFVRQND